MIKRLYELSQIAILLASIVVILGAYTRLTDAGLGCPDWPGCYGFLSVPSSTMDVTAANLAFPERPVETEKAWNEMIHRYFAGSLGLVIFAIFALCLKVRVNVGLSSLLLLVVCFQALLGMLTVTMNLMPLVVMAHLLGGFTTFCLLILLNRSLHRRLAGLTIDLVESLSPFWNGLAKTSLLVLVLQIGLGGWVAANYSAVACTELPICEAGWQQKFSVSDAFTLPTGHENYEYGVLPYEARMSMHVLHRLGALLVTLLILLLSMKLMRHRGLQKHGVLLSGLVLLQCALGISNVYFYLPLYVAVAHNFVALCLVAAMSVLFFRLSTSPRFAKQPVSLFDIQHNIRSEGTAYVK